MTEADREREVFPWREVHFILAPANNRALGRYRLLPPIDPESIASP